MVFDIEVRLVGVAVFIVHVGGTRDSGHPFTCIITIAVEDGEIDAFTGVNDAVFVIICFRVVRIKRYQPSSPALSASSCTKVPLVPSSVVYSSVERPKRVSSIEAYRRRHR